MINLPLTLSPCTPAATNQTFKFAVVPPYVEPAAIAVYGEGFCLSKQSVGSAVSAFPCGLNPMNSRADQYWKLQNDTLVSLQVDTPFCFGIAEGGAGELVDCASENAQFNIGFQGRRYYTLGFSILGYVYLSSSRIKASQAGP